MSDQHKITYPLPFAECRYSTNSGREYKAHIHEGFSVGAITDGEVIYQVGDQQARLRPGSVALINPETLHACNPTQLHTRSYYMLFLSVEWCLQLQQSLWPIESFRPVNTIILDDEAIYGQYIQTMDALREEGDLLEKEHRLAELIERIFLQTCEPTTDIATPPVNIEAMKQILGTELEVNTSLSQIAEALHTNPYTMLRQFKAVTGITPHAYRLNCRIEQAKKLLRQGLALSEVALACGFFDQSHFHHHFKAMTTLTPKAYQLNFFQ